MLVKTIEEAFANQGIDITKLPDVSMLPEKYQRATVGFYKASVLCDELNDGWEPDWSNTDQRKYQILFEVKANKKNPEGIGLSYIGVDNGYQDTHAPSRLCFKDWDTAQYAAEKFPEVFAEFFLNK